MDSLKDILAKKDIEEPTEITALKQYCKDEFNIQVRTAIKGGSIWLFAPNGILATELRMRLPEIQRRCQLTQKLVIRIG
jgi:hypothetical protein